MDESHAIVCALFLYLSFLHTLLISCFDSFRLILSLSWPWLLDYLSNKDSGRTCKETNDDSIQTLDRKALGYSLYEGVVTHIRHFPKHHSFQYTVRLALINMDKAPHWFVTSSSKHHLSGEEARKLAGTTGEVHLLTNPVSVGYEQNPISVFFCYNEGTDGEPVLANCIAEVTNTPWGERCVFTFDPRDELPKPLHVSPFMDMNSKWKFQTSSPCERLKLTITASHPDMGDYFIATLNCLRVLKPVHPEWFLWLQPQCIAFWIYWQAFLLWFKGIPLVEHPKYTDGNAYRQRVLVRNETERTVVCQKRREKDVKVNPNINCAEGQLNKRSGCVFAWRDAQGWPWK